MNPIAIGLAVEATRRHAMSALPHAAPVVPPPDRLPRHPSVLRLALATGLRHFADRLDRSGEPQRGMA
jgi:hypothetical protein